MLQKLGPKLEVLNLASTAISDQGESAAPGFHRVYGSGALTLSFFSLFHLTVLQGVSKFCWKLKSLNVSSCPMVHAFSSLVFFVLPPSQLCHIEIIDHRECLQGILSPLLAQEPLCLRVRPPFSLTANPVNKEIDPSLFNQSAPKSTIRAWPMPSRGARKWRRFQSWGACASQSSASSTLDAAFQTSLLSASMPMVFRLWETTSPWTTLSWPWQRGVRN